MLLAKLITALTIALSGTIVLFCLGFFSVGLVGSCYDLISCFIGAFCSSYLFVRPGTLSFRSNITPAIKIVFATLLVIAVGHAFEQVFSRQVSIDFEPLGMLFWATVITSWWLIPLTAFLLCLINRISLRRAQL